jgi:dephospho-CoA kinase
MLRELGAQVIDADEVARFVVEPGQPAYQRLVAAFGPSILVAAPQDSATETPAIDRQKLAARVFGDEAALKQLNRITHPEIAAESARRMQAAMLSGAEVIVYEAALIVENKLYPGFSGLIVVQIPEAMQVERAVRRSGLTPEQALSRIRAQASPAERAAVANWLVDNSGDEPALRAQVQTIWEALLAGHVPPCPAA